jgi:glycine/D-amino acid oxidase-like deaminating enzyme
MPFRPAKGDVLLAKIPAWKHKEIIHKNIFVIPWGDDVYWIGSNFDQRFTDVSPSEKIRGQLLESWAMLSGHELEIVDHVAGIRPCMPDRRPVVMEHPEKKGLWLFNGMGTKGASLAPYMAKRMVDEWLGKDSLPDEVSGRRFK